MLRVPITSKVTGSLHLSRPRTPHSGAPQSTIRRHRFPLRCPPFIGYPRDVESEFLGFGSGELEGSAERGDVARSGSLSPSLPVAAAASKNCSSLAVSPQNLFSRQKCEKKPSGNNRVSVNKHVNF